MALGRTAAIARFAFEGAQNGGPFLAACRKLDRDVARKGKSKAGRLGLRDAFGAADDAALRRLAIADRLVRAGFDPDETRDSDGEWTGGGASAPAVATASTTAAGSAIGDLVAGAESNAWRLWGADALALVPRVASSLNVFALAGGLVLIPENRSGELESHGTLPDNPDIAFARSEGRLTLWSVDADGNRTEIYNGYPGADHFYRDPDGQVIARDLGLKDGFVADPFEIAELAVRASRPRRGADAAIGSTGDVQAGAGAKAVAKDTPQLCPDPSPDRPGYKSERSIKYQALVSGLPPGWAILYNGVVFDGCRGLDGVLLEAKAWGFEWAMDYLDDDDFMSPDAWRPWYRGRESIENQMRRQSQAAGLRRVEWYFAEEGPANYFRWYAREAGLSNIEVFYMPAELLGKGIVAPWLFKPGSEFVSWLGHRHFAQEFCA